MEWLLHLPIKILVSGSFGTGKTTLVTSVSQLLPGLMAAEDIIPDVARRCPFNLNKEQTLPVSIWLLAEQIKAESTALIGRQPHFLLCDRGIPDIVSHTLPIISKDYACELEGPFIAIAKAWAKTYSRVFLAERDPSQCIEADDLRLADPQYQLQMEQSLKEALALLALPYSVLPVSHAARVRVLRDCVTNLARAEG